MVTMEMKIIILDFRAGSQGIKQLLTHYLHRIPWWLRQ